jgi:hypothetical protein
MKNKICTSRRQAKKLIKLGIDENTADMTFNVFGWSFVRDDDEELDEYNTPCWSLSALLNILHNYTLQTTTNGKVFVVCDNKKPIVSDIYNNPVDACVNTIIKLKKMKLI